MKTLLFNGLIYTQDNGIPWATSMIVDQNKIARVSSNEQTDAVVDKKIDLKGALVLPGFNDSHLHCLNYAYSLQKIDLQSMGSFKEIEAETIRYIKKKKTPYGKWILGRGLNDIHLKENRLPTKEDLDKISQKHPLCFTRICEHVVVVNSKALEICGISSETTQPDQGSFDLGGDGEPNGIFREGARYLIYEHIPPATKEEIKEMLVEAMDQMVSYGITSIQSDDFETFSDKDYEKVISAYRELEEEKRLPLRVYEQCLLPDINRLKRFLDKGYSTGWGTDFFRIGPLKLLTDGSLGGRTALLREPYSDQPDTGGISAFNKEELDELVITAHKGQMQILCHAIGDLAMDNCLSSFEKAKEIMPKEDARFGIVHVQITQPDHFKRFKDLDVIAYIEPICVNNDLHMALDRIGIERLRTSYAYKTFLKSGIPTAISSDCPVDSVRPMDSLYVSVTRKDYSGYPEGGWYPKESLSLEETIYCFTQGSAYCSYDEHKKGKLSPGYLADLVILDRNIFALPPEEWLHTKVIGTMVDGEWVYSELWES